MLHIPFGVEEGDVQNGKFLVREIDFLFSVIAVRQDKPGCSSDLQGGRHVNYPSHM